MRKKSIAAILSALLVVSVMPIGAQVSAIVIGNYVRQYRGASDQYVTDIAINRANGDVFVVGNSSTRPDSNGPISSVASESAVGFLSRIDVQGAVKWTKLVGRAWKSVLDVSIARDSAGSLYLAINDLTVTAQSTAYGVVVEKWSPEGTRLWQKVLTTTTRAVGPNITVGTNGVYVSFSQANTTVGGRGGYDGIVTRLNATTGAVASEALVGSSADDFLSDVAILSDSTVVVSGNTNGVITGNRSSLRTDSDFFTTRFNATLTSSLTKRQWGTRFNEVLRAIAPLSNGEYAVVGSTSGAPDGLVNRGRFDGVVSKLTATGTLVWSTLIGSTADDSIEDVVQAPFGGNIVVTGNTGGTVFGSAGGTDFIGATLNSAGAVVAWKQLGTAQNDVAYALDVRSDGSPVIVGSTTGTLDGTAASMRDGFVMSAGVDIGSISQFVGSSNNFPIVSLPALGLVLIPASEQAGAVGGVNDPYVPPPCNEVVHPTTRWRREIALCAGLTVKRGTTTKIRLSLQNKAGVCSLTPRRRLKLNAAGTCKVRIRATQSNGSTRAVWVTYKVF